MLISLLEKIGLSEKEAKVYLASLELGEDSVQNIGKKASVNRATTYVILEKLMTLGLVSTYEKDKKTVFVAEDPKELVHIIDEEKRAVEEREHELKENINQITALYNRNKNKPTVRFFEGADGLEALDRYGRNWMKKNSEILSITPIDVIEKMFPERRKKSLSERVRLGIKARTIYTHENGEIPGFVNDGELRDGVFIPRDKFPLNATINIYPDWGIKFYYFDENKPYGVIVESPGLAKNMALFYELAWQGAKNTKK